MKVCGFTFVRNAVKYDYPVVESIRSALPLCDDFIVCVGNSEDETEDLIRSIDDRIKIFNSVWDETLRQGGRVLAAETDKAMDHISEKYDWLLYLQADEVLHEQDHAVIKNAMAKYKDDKEVEGLLLNYRHFYGTYDYIADSRNWYRREVRIIRSDKSIRSYKDAQGFRKSGKKLHVKPVDAWVYHYGWVKDPYAQKAKERSFHKYWHDDAWMKINIKESDLFDYSKIDSLKKFQGMHPEVMKMRIAERSWNLEFDPQKKNLKFKDRVLMYFEKAFGYRPFEYKNYKVI